MKEVLILEKLKISPVEQEAEYSFKANYQLASINLNDLIGKEISLRFTGNINCIYCQKQIKKTFNQGYCFPCSQKLARCDLCILKPELCHFHKGTCREPKWGEEHCFIPHILYLANSTGLKVGITREHQKLTRWFDQGAISAIPVCRVKDRLTSGKLEEYLKKSYNDKSNWRNLLIGKELEIDLIKEREKVISLLPQEYLETVLPDSEAQLVSLSYPVNEYLSKAISHNLDKEPVLKGELKGLRGQYMLIGDSGINIRKYQGYGVEVVV